MGHRRCGRRGPVFGADIVLTKTVGQAFDGLQGLTISLTAAALVSVPFGLGQFEATALAWQIAGAVRLGVVMLASIGASAASNAGA